MRLPSSVLALIWDNDGVLVDSEELFYQCTHEAFASLGVELSRSVWARDYLGRSKRSRDLAVSLGADLRHVDRMIETRNHTYRNRLAKEAPILPHVRETLEQLSGRLPMAIVTGSDRAHLEEMHRHSGLLRYFNPIVCQDDYEKPKPDPEGYQLAVKQLGVPAHRCLAVEDSPRGVAAALAAGIPCLLVPTSLTDLSLCEGNFHLSENVGTLLSLFDSPT